MVGHQQVIAARLRGLRPGTIFFEIGPLPVVKFNFDEPENALDCELYPTVFVDHSELKNRVDLRFVVGCYVGVACQQIADDEVLFAEALQGAGARAVVVCDGREILHFSEEKEWRAYADFD